MAKPPVVVDSADVEAVVREVLRRFPQGTPEQRADVVEVCAELLSGKDQMSPEYTQELIRLARQKALWWRADA